MGLLNFGKRKDRDIDEYFVRENTDDRDKNNIPNDTNEENYMKEEDIEENKSYYIDPDDLNYNNYEDIVDAIENNGWTRVSPNGYPLSILNTRIVFPKPIKANFYGIILEIICPQDRIISICGTNDCNIDTEDFHNVSNFYQVPHFLTLRSMNSENVDIFPTTIISIMKNNINEETEIYYEAFYGDLSPITDDGKLKKKHERYYFADTIILQSGERLIFRANNPNIDISKIDVLMMSDLFEKDEE